MEKPEFDTIVFYDTETTGLPKWKGPSDSEEQPHLVSICAIQCDTRTRGIINRFYNIVKPNGWVIPREATEINGITTEYALKYGIAEKTVIKQLIVMCKNALRVAHNRTFDQRIIRIALKRFSFHPDIIEDWGNKDFHECTMLQSKWVMKMKPYNRYGPKNPKLEEAYQFFRNKTLGTSAHNAEADTQACMEIYWSIQDWKKRECEKKIADLVEPEISFADLITDLN